MNRLFTILILALIAMLTMNLQCGEDEVYAPYKHWFKTSVSLSPYQLDYRVGDTIWLRLSAPGKLLYDTISGKTIRYDSASFNSEASIHIVYNNPLITTGPFASYIFPDNIVGNTNNYNGYTTADVNFGCSPSSDYSLQLGIVLLQKGVFNLSFRNSSMNKCFTNNFDYTNATFYFDVPDTHLSYYQQLPLDSIGVAQDSYVVQSLQNKSSVIINVN